MVYLLEQRAGGVVADIDLLGSALGPEREDFEAGEPRLDLDRSSPSCRAIAAIARSMKVVVNGNSTGSAAKPNSPLTPPVTPARNDENQVAGVGGGSSSSVSMATSRPFITADRTIALKLIVGDLRQDTQHAVDRNAGIVGEPRGEIRIFEVLYRRFKAV